MAIREDLLLKIMDIVAASGTSFALPSRTLYVGRDAYGGRDQPLDGAHGAGVPGAGGPGRP
jgi:MscS family membrane protein